MKGRAVLPPRDKAYPKGVKSMGLGCDVGNTRAIALHKTGWQEDDWAIKYALKL